MLRGLHIAPLSARFVQKLQINYAFRCAVGISDELIEAIGEPNFVLVFGDGDDKRCAKRVVKLQQWNWGRGPILF